MFNLLKSDIYRLVHGKMLWVAAIVLVALSVLAAGMMHWVSSPEFLRMTATSFEMTVNVSDGVTGGAGVLGEGDAAAANASAEAAAAASASGRGLSLDELDTLGAAEAAGSAESEEDSERAAEQRQFQRDLASLSHDIRTPLMGAKGYVSMAAEEPDDARRAHYLQAAEARLADMEGLLDALFAYARATDAASDLDRRPLVVLPVLADVLTGQFPAFEERGWEPAVDFPDESLVVEADSEALARMFENLVSNALRYGTSAPSIIQRGRTLTFSNKVPDPAAIDVNRLFERFYRADVARAQGGAGLGLAVVASLATAQNIEVEASLEGDELFLTLVFPATP